ncbi:UNVERIFIED_CONTAM: hypothetical protein HDU68_001391 [Siphonaria sp. JEL0065]|nr:hypothetical protein HDU68_001391 [Siphonaria sp. JEL0065]
MKFSLATALCAVSMACKVYAAVTSCGINTYMVILLENEDQVNVIADPYFKSLAAKGYNMGNYYGVAHPSQPNYIAMVSGSVNNCYGDENININARSIADLLEAKGLTWKAYNEGYPGNCFLDATSGRYARKHNPFLSFTNIQGNSARCAKIVDSTQLDADASSGKLPNYAFFTPDLYNDGHDTSIPYTSSWLQGFLEPKLTNPAYANTLFHIVFDESATYSPNQIYSVFVGAGVTAGAVDNTQYDHYSGLATVESIFGLGNLGLSDASAKVIPFGCSSGGPISAVTTTTVVVASSTTTTTTSSGSNCFAAWVSTQSYPGGSTVSYNNINYKNSWWESPGAVPGATNGDGGWVSQGACGSQQTTSTTTTTIPVKSSSTTTTTTLVPTTATTTTTVKPTTTTTTIVVPPTTSTTTTLAPSTSSTTTTTLKPTTSTSTTTVPVKSSTTTTTTAPAKSSSTTTTTIPVVTATAGSGGPVVGGSCSTGTSQCSAGTMYFCQGVKWIVWYTGC